MPVIKAVDADLALVRQFIQDAPRRQVGLGDEDLAALVRAGHVLLALDDAQADDTQAVAARTRRKLPVQRKAVQALAAFYPEPRPSSLPLPTPARVYLHAAAFRSGVSPSTAMQQLVAAWDDAPAPTPRLLIAYGGEPWYNRSLLAAGCVQAEEVVYFELPALDRALAGLPPVSPAEGLRLASPAELEQLALLDAACFNVLWHMGVADLRQLLIFGSVMVAERDGVLAGYLALTFQERVAQVARLAVHPAWSGLGLGRHLLAEGLQGAAELGCTSAILNTQSTNSRAQALYRAFGFRPTGQRFQVYTHPALA